MTACLGERGVKPRPSAKAGATPVRWGRTTSSGTAARPTLRPSAVVLPCGEVSQPAWRISTERLVTSAATITPIVTSAIRIVEAALISGVTPSRTEE